MRLGADTPDQLGPPETTQRLDEVAGETTDIHFDTLRQEREGAGAVSWPARFGLRQFQSIDCEPRNPQHRLRVLPENTIERLAGDTGQLGIAQCNNIGGTRPARDQTHFADCVAREYPAYEPAPIAAFG